MTPPRSRTGSTSSSTALTGSRAADTASGPLLEAVRAQRPSGPRLVAYFAVTYYAGLRPEEAINLSRDNVILPPHDRPDDDGWGELHIRRAAPDAGGEWNDDGSVREMRQLKHRAEGDSRV